MATINGYLASLRACEHRYRHAHENEVRMHNLFLMVRHACSLARAKLYVALRENGYTHDLILQQTSDIDAVLDATRSELPDDDWNESSDITKRGEFGRMTQGDYGNACYEKRIDQLTAALRAVEWVSNAFNDCAYPYCPLCYNPKPHGHASSCLIGMAELA